jgi:DNA (cytosine-5)-methyltransferase 1
LSDPGDIHQLEPRQLLRQTGLKPRQLTLLAGGPPCQPFSKSMYWSTGDAPRLRDPRAKTLHAYLDVVEATLPQVLLLGVKGPFGGKDEGLRLRTTESTKALDAQTITLNAADYGVPRSESACRSRASTAESKCHADHGAGR